MLVLENAQHSMNKQATFIQKIEPIYVNIVLIVWPIFLLFGYFLMGWDLNTTLYLRPLLIGNGRTADNHLPHKQNKKKTIWKLQSKSSKEMVD